LRPPLEARNLAEQAEQQVVRAHAGTGEVREGERALDRAERQSRNAGLAVRGAQLRLDEAKAEADRYQREHMPELIAEMEESARECLDMGRRGVELIKHFSAPWYQLAQQASEHVVAAGLQPTGNMPAEHELHQIARDLRNFDGNLTAPLPHFHHRSISEQDERTKSELREQAA
jgi:hypothetical protein